MLESQAEHWPQWWKDLLSLWRPSGVDAGVHGLRLAVRNNYMNFYRRGQSVARVEIDSKGVPTATTHFKYVCNKNDVPKGQEYVKLKSKDILRGGKFWKQYEEIEDLKGWIAAIDKGYTGEEKRFVDQLVAANPSVIDLEMGLPAWGDEKSAPRIDLVAIEGGKVVFWEAKLVMDGRLRCRADLDPDKKPEVLKQLAKYRLFLNHEKEGAKHVKLVASAYQDAAKLLMTLRSMADKLGEKHTLGTDIYAAVSGLDVDPEPCLVIDNRTNSTSWPCHEAKLDRANVPMKIIGPDDSFVLSRPQ